MAASCTRRNPGIPKHSPSRLPRPCLVFLPPSLLGISKGQTFACPNNCRYPPSCPRRTGSGSMALWWESEFLASAATSATIFKAISLCRMGSLGWAVWLQTRAQSGVEPINHSLSQPVWRLATRQGSDGLQRASHNGATSLPCNTLDEISCDAGAFLCGRRFLRQRFRVLNFLKYSVA